MMIVDSSNFMFLFRWKRQITNKKNKNIYLKFICLLMRLFVFLCIFIFNSKELHAQKDSYDPYFGFQIKPIFPGVFIGTTQFEATKDGFSTSFSQAMGFSFGGIIRFGITKLITIETGLNLTQRKYRFSSSFPDSNVFVQSKIRYLTYDLPASFLVYMPLTNEWYMNASIGGALIYNPTIVGVRRNVPNTLHQVSQLGVGKKLLVEMVANIGWEYRDKKYGIFYIGATARVPFSPLFRIRSEYSNQGLKIQTDPDAQGKVDGSYIALEIKYFFPIIKSLGSPIKMPIE